MARVAVYGVEQAMWGADSPVEYYFRTKAERDEYILNHDYCNRIKTVTMLPENAEILFCKTDFLLGTGDILY